MTLKQSKILFLMIGHVANSVHTVLGEGSSAVVPMTKSKNNDRKAISIIGNGVVCPFHPNNLEYNPKQKTQSHS